MLINFLSDVLLIMRLCLAEVLQRRVRLCPRRRGVVVGAVVSSSVLCPRRCGVVVGAVLLLVRYCVVGAFWV